MAAKSARERALDDAKEDVSDVTHQANRREPTSLHILSYSQSFAAVEILDCNCTLTAYLPMPVLNSRMPVCQCQY